MKRLFLTIVLLSTVWSSSFATDVIITTDGDVTAGTGRLHSRSTSNSNGVTGVLVGRDSASSTSHTMWYWWTGTDGATWSERVTRPFTATGGFTSSELDPILCSFDTTSGSEEFWALPPTTYSGSNMQARLITSGSVIGSMDTISPATTTMATGLMRWTGDTLIYAERRYLATPDITTLVVVKSNGAWSQSVTWTPIDSGTTEVLSCSFSDYCGTGVAIWDESGRDLYWIDGTVNDAIKTLGTDNIPALLSTNKENATTMAVYRDSMIVVIGYLARDTALWQYRWWATGGTRKTGLTLIDSTRLLNKAFFVGTAVDSTSPMPCLTGSANGDTATLITRMWFNPSNTDSIVLGYSTAVWAYGFDSANLVNNNISYGEGLRYRGLNCPRYWGAENVMAFWQKGVSTPDSIWVSYENKLTTVIERLSQVKSDGFSSGATFQGTSEVEDCYLNNANPTFNYGATTTINIGNGSATTNSVLMRPALSAFRTKLLYPCHIVWCSLEVKTSATTSTGSYTVPVMKLWKPVYEGTQNGATTGDDSGATHGVARTGLSWGQAGASLSSGLETYNSTSGAGRDRSAGQVSTSWTGWNGLAANTLKGKSLLLLFETWQKYLKPHQSADSNYYGWIKLATSNASSVTIYSSETATSTDGPKFYFNAYYTEPGVRRNNTMNNYRRRYITPGFRYKKI